MCRRKIFQKISHKKKDCCFRSTRIVFIGPTLILIRTLRLSMRNLPWGFDTTMRLGDGISTNVTWIHLCRRRTEVQACNESGRGWSILLDFRANLWAASDLYRAAEISAAKLSNPSGTSRHNNQLLLLFPVCLS